MNLTNHDNNSTNRSASDTVNDDGRRLNGAPKNVVDTVQIIMNGTGFSATPSSDDSECSPQSQSTVDNTLNSLLSSNGKHHQRNHLMSSRQLQPTLLLNNGNAGDNCNGNNILHGIDFNVSQLYNESLDVTSLFMSQQLNGHLQGVGNLAAGGQLAAASATSLGLPASGFASHQSLSSAANSNQLHLVSQLPLSNNSGSLQSVLSASETSSSSNCSVRPRHRSSANDSIFKCSYCPKKYNSQEALNNHMNECRHIRIHACSQCDKRFKARGGLQQHNRIHVNDKAYHCQYCSKRFTQKSHLDQHERIHTGLKPYICQFCGRAFRQRSQQQGHEATHATGSSAGGGGASGLSVVDPGLEVVAHQQHCTMMNNGGNSISLEHANASENSPNKQNSNKSHCQHQNHYHQQQILLSQQQQLSFSLPQKRVLDGLNEGKVAGNSNSSHDHVTMFLNRQQRQQQKQ